MFTFLDDLQDLSVFKCWLFFFFLNADISYFK